MRHEPLYSYDISCKLEGTDEGSTYTFEWKKTVECPSAANAHALLLAKIKTENLRMVGSPVIMNRGAARGERRPLPIPPQVYVPPPKITALDPKDFLVPSCTYKVEVCTDDATFTPGHN